MDRMVGPVNIQSKPFAALLDSSLSMELMFSSHMHYEGLLGSRVLD